MTTITAVHRAADLPAGSHVVPCTRDGRPCSPDDGSYRVARTGCIMRWSQPIPGSEGWLVLMPTPEESRETYDRNTARLHALQAACGRMLVAWAQADVQVDAFRAVVEQSR